MVMTLDEARGEMKAFAIAGTKQPHPEKYAHLIQALLIAEESIRKIPELLDEITTLKKQLEERL